MLKSKKPSDKPRSYRPISLLSCLYKIIEYIILFRIGPIIDQMLPMEQTGFTPGRDTTDQNLTLTSFVEACCEKRLKTGIVFFNLSAACDTVWYNGLMLKLIKRTIKLLKRMIGSRNFTVLLGGDLRKTRTIKNSVHRD